MNLQHAFLILTAFCGAMLVALSLSLLNIVKLQPYSAIKNQVRHSDDLQRRDHTISNVGLPNYYSVSAINHSTGKCSVSNFPFRRGFSFPQPLIMKPLQEMDSAQWICNLRQYLSDFKSEKPVALVTSNNKYTDVLLNWLISAVVRSSIPLKTILVISMEERLHKILVRRGIPSVFISPSMLFRQDAKFSQMFEQVMMLRLTVMCIINHFGFDVVMYDTDAVILRDPQPLYDQLPNDDIIGSVGKIPKELVDEWGITICIGVVLVKSSVLTETYWNSMKDVCIDVLDDQGKLNCGLKALDIQWVNNESSYQTTTIHGRGRNGLAVSILQYDYICRQTTCDPKLRNSYYIWHKGGSRTRRDKLRSARDGQTWFLQYKWASIKNDYLGEHWLSSICYPGVTHS